MHDVGHFRQNLGGFRSGCGIYQGLPGMSGLDLLPKVKERKPALPVFMISAYGDADTVTAALERGADEFLTKPVDFAKLRRDIMTVKADAMRRDA